MSLQLDDGRPMRRIAIVNRGDAALRLIRAVREYNLQHGTELVTIALHSEEEQQATFAREADEAVCIGPAHVTLPDGRRQLAYVTEEILTRALRCARADTVWVGWGFVSERPEFADLCDRLGLRLVGPSGDVMRQLGHKVGAKLLAESAGVPVVPWSGGLVASAEEAEEHAARIGFPLMVKAAAGGGGRGIRRVDRPEELADAFRSAAREAESAFGDGSLFLERAVTGARHVEVQVAADVGGTVRAVGIRDCSVQRRRQKILEESGVPGLPEPVVATIKAAAVRLLGATAYAGLGTVEFLLDPTTDDFYFMEVNTRLQVEHTVTEEVIGLDLVKLQLELAAGRPLTLSATTVEQGYAIEARVTAEDPLDGFRPAPGEILDWRPAVGPGLRMDTGVSIGDPTPSEYDPLLVKIIARGADRDEALARLRRGVSETRLVLRNGATTLGFLRSLLAVEPVLAGGATTEFVDELVAKGEPLVEERSELAILLVAVELAARRWEDLRDHLFSTAGRGRAELVAAAPYEVEVTHRSATTTVAVRRLAREEWAVDTSVGTVRVTTTGSSGLERRALVGGVRVAACVVDVGDAMEVTLDGSTYRISYGGEGVVASPLPAMVVSVRVEAGDAVEAGDVLALLESMKLETALRAPRAGLVREVYVEVNAQVAAGQRVVRLETSSSDVVAEAPETGVMASLVAGSADVESPWAPLARLEGYDGSDDRRASSSMEGRLLDLFSRCAAVSGGRSYESEPNGHATRGADALSRVLSAPQRAAELVPEEWYDELTELTELIELLDEDPDDPSSLREGLYRVVRAAAALHEVEPFVVGVLRGWLATDGADLRRTLDLRDVERAAVSCEVSYPLVGDLVWAALRRFWLVENDEVRTGGVPPETAERLEFWRFDNFHSEHRVSCGDVHVLELTAPDNPADHRLVAVGGAAAHPTDTEETVRIVEGVLLEAFARLREIQATVPLPERSQLNRVVLYVDGEWNVPDDVLQRASRRLAPAARNLGVERVVVRVHRDGDEQVLHLTGPAEAGLSLGSTRPSRSPMRTMSPRQQHLLKLHRRGLFDPYEIADMLVARNASFSDFPPGRFTELDFDEAGRLVAVDRPPGENVAGVVVGLVENATAKHPEGLARVILLGDPGRGLGALSEPECRRIVAALDLATERGVPLEWFTVSSGAKISMSSGTENLDWTARVLRHLVEATQAGVEVNIVLVGVNVGAQSYFDAEATMLMHTRGILVMTPGSSMVLTGKDALDFAGGVSAEDNVGIGGHARIMGPNGQAQYWAASVQEACTILFRHYEHAYVAPGERHPRRAPTSDPADRDVTVAPHPVLPNADFRTVGEIFSDAHNPGRNRQFDMRALMSAVVDHDHQPLERWRELAGGEGTIVWDAHLGGIPVSLLGIESRPLPRAGVPASDGPQSWSAATLFPQSSKKLARALNAASDVRPAVVLANLAGFDGSPESLRNLQLEYGAEIGRAVTNFRGPIVFCVVSRYHGGAFVVFSKALNDRLEVLALEGARASVIGGSAAAAVVFGREVERRVAQDPRLAGTVSGADRAVAAAEREALRATVRADVRKSLADEFDRTHTVERAREVGSVDRIIRARDLRPSLIESLERGLADPRGERP